MQTAAALSPFGLFLQAGMIAKTVILLLLAASIWCWVLIIEGVRAKFMRLLETGRMSPRTRTVVKRLGMIGTTARGAIFALAGALVVEAAINYQPSKARGLDKALLTLRGQPFGEVLLGAAALGLIIFGIYALCEARWHKV